MGWIVGWFVSGAGADRPSFLLFFLPNTHTNDQGKIRGYIAHEKRVVVLSKEQPFPPY